MRVNIELETSQTLDDETEVFTEYETGILRKTMDGGIIITYFDDGVHNEILLDQDFTEVKVVRDFDEITHFSTVKIITMRLLTKRKPAQWTWNFTQN